MKSISVGLMLLAMSGPATAQTNILDKANNFLGRLTGTPATQRQPSTAFNSNAALNRQTPSQLSAQQTALATPVQALIAADRAEAKVLIDRLVSVSACAINDTAWHSVNRYSENPKTYETYNKGRSSVGNTKYHSKGNCLDVLRVTKWAKPAKNALSFQVQLVSAQSDEAVSQSFVIVKDDANQWLVRSIDYVTS
jgi:hypothetical protein